MSEEKIDEKVIAKVVEDESFQENEEVEEEEEVDEEEEEYLEQDRR